MAGQSKESSVVAGLYAQYMRSMTTRPLLTKCATAAFLNSLQEHVASAIGGKNPFSGRVVERSFQLGAFGFIVSGPIGHYLFDWVDRLANNLVDPSTPVLNQAARLFLTNTIVVPISVAAFLYCLAKIDGLNHKKAIERMKANLFTILRANITINPPIQALVFNYLPKQFWVPVLYFVRFILGLYANVKARVK